MLFSLYPSDSDEVRQSVVEQAKEYSPERVLFTSLHIPESALGDFLEYLTRLRNDEGFTYCADISPLTLTRLGVGESGIGELRSSGVESIRIDFGFDPDQVRQMARAGPFAVAVNASTMDESTLDSLSDLPLIGWHNYYPKPETGLTTEFFLRQNTLFETRGFPTRVFLPGESNFRAPLHQGLPTLESHRYRNAYSNYSALRALCPSASVVCAEGVLRAEHMGWISHLDATGEVTMPLTGVDRSVEFLRGGVVRVRAEESASSWRLEETRGARAPADPINADHRARGSLQMDLPSRGRYLGELQIMRRDLPLSASQVRVADIAAPYLGLVEALRPGARVRFVW